MNAFKHKTMFLLTAGLIVAAAQGPTELRRFVERTRTIYGLYYEDYAQRTQPGAVAAASQDRSKSASSAEPAQTASAH
jgi:hypothetical protein